MFGKFLVTRLNHRVLEQQWGEKIREEMKGARELVYAILKYRNVMESDIQTLLHIPVIDTRDEDERRIDRTIQSIGHRFTSSLANIYILLDYLYKYNKMKSMFAFVVVTP